MRGIFYTIKQQYMETWKDIKGYEGSYQVSDKGNVRSLDRHIQSRYGTRKIKGCFLKKLCDKDGYHKVNLKQSQKGKNCFIHRLVAIAFIENDKNKPQVNHKNGVKNDNNVENLEWVTLSENRQHAYDTGLQNGLNRRGSKSNFSKLKKEDVYNIRKLLKNGIKQKCIASIYKISQSGVSTIKKNKNWSWLN